MKAQNSCSFTACTRESRFRFASRTYEKDEAGSSGAPFDMYETYRTGQFAEISGVPDDTFEFAVTADPDDTILETDENNHSSVLFRLQGDTVQVLPEAAKVSRGIEQVFVY